MSPKDNAEAAGRDSVRKALSEARSSVRLEGEVVHREGGGIAIRRGGSVFEVEGKDIVAVRELERGTTEVLVKPDAQLVRSTVMVSRWFGSRIGWRPVFDDCGDCTECSVCADCTECSVCIGECSVCIGGVGGLPGRLNRGALSAWIRFLGGGGVGRFARMDRRRLRSR